MTLFDCIIKILLTNHHISFTKSKLKVKKKKKKKNNNKNFLRIY